MEYIIKRNGEKQAFDKMKIIRAIEASFMDVDHEVSNVAHQLAESIATIISQMPNSMNVEDIQDKVEELLMLSNRKDCARNYVQYRFKRSLMRRENTTDKDIISLVEGKNEYWNDENANKNAKVAHTMRDYLAGIVSTDISRRLLIPEDIVKAHDDGIIHMHDLDYLIQPIHNCELINLEDMLQNGTVINGVKIDKPRRLLTAANIATQITAFVSGSSFGGSTISLTHLAPFVEESRKRFRARFEKMIDDEALLSKLVEEETNKEIVDSMQTIFYQLNSLNSSNGQAPFVSVCMYLNEAENEQLKSDLAKLIEEMLKQRIQGFKNEKGVYITPAFPKLLYFLEEDNIRPGTKYWYLTELAARCCAKRMAPDFISEKVMKEFKNNHAYPCMGAVKGDSRICWKIGRNGIERCGSFEEFWNMICENFEVINQPGRLFDLYANLMTNPNIDNVYVKDTRHKWVLVKKATKMITNNWVRIMTHEGVEMFVTPDHPFPVIDENSLYVAPDKRYNVKGYRRTEAASLKVGDKLRNAKTYEDLITTIEMIEIAGNGEFAYDVETESDTFEFNDVWSCNCRSFLTPDTLTENYSHALNYDKQKASVTGVSYGRFNQGVATINLPDVALSALKEYESLKHPDGVSSFDIFWRIFDERLELCHRALLCRHERLSKAISDNAPILWQHGALARLQPGESIEELLHHNYSTISVGYAGLYECVKVMTGLDQSKGFGKEFGLSIMKHMNDKAEQWKQEHENTLAFSVYGTPIESTAWKFAKALKRHFGDDVFVKLDGHDRMFITNSYHLPVWENFTGFEKLSIESEFQRLSPGGAVSYIECCDLTKNIPALLEIIHFIYETIMYAEINLRNTDTCFECGFEGEIQIIDKDNKLIWHCPKCGNEDPHKMSTKRRVCGYLTSGNSFNFGRMNDMKDRVLHIDDMKE